MLWPSASASAYEEVLGYALWPGDYGERFWSRGAGDIMSAMLMPRRSARKVKVAICSTAAKEQAQQPFERAEEELELTDVQRRALNDLRAAVKVAVDREKTACRDRPPATPAQRLKAVVDALWALHYAASFVRAPLERFYGTLTDPQKAKLAEEADAGLPACNQATAAVPTTNESAQDLAKFLAATCPKEAPSTPVARLDAAGERLATMAYAAMSIDPARMSAQPGSKGQHPSAR